MFKINFSALAANLLHALGFKDLKADATNEITEAQAADMISKLTAKVDELQTTTAASLADINTKIAFIKALEVERDTLKAEVTRLGTQPGTMGTKLDNTDTSHTSNVPAAYETSVDREVAAAKAKADKLRAARTINSPSQTSNK